MNIFPYRGNTFVGSKDVEIDERQIKIRNDQIGNKTTQELEMWMEPLKYNPQLDIIKEKVNANPAFYQPTL